MMDEASDLAFAALHKNKGDVLSLSLPMQTVVVIYTAQGIIDNGGLEYFFESDFPSGATYYYIMDAYRRIGASAVAECIEAAVRMFPFQDAHLKSDARNNYLAALGPDESRAFTSCSEAACGNKDVWVCLEEYVSANFDAFREA